MMHLCILIDLRYCGNSNTLYKTRAVAAIDKRGAGTIIFLVVVTRLGRSQFLALAFVLATAWIECCSDAYQQ